MSYRDDLDAAHARNAALERELDEAKRETQALQRRIAQIEQVEQVGRHDPVARRQRGYAPLRFGGLALLVGGGAAFVLAVYHGATAGAAAALIVLVAGIAAGMVADVVEVADPDELVVLSGGQRGIRIIQPGARGVRVPLIEAATRLRLTVPPDERTIRGVYTRGGLPCDVVARVRVRISVEDERARRAIERFLGTAPEQIARVAGETVEGAVRGVLADLTLDEARLKPTKLVDAATQVAAAELDRLGLELDALQLDVRAE